MYSAAYVWPMFDRQGWFEFQQARVMLTMHHIRISLDELRQASRTTIKRDNNIHAIRYAAYLHDRQNLHPRT